MNPAIYSIGVGSGYAADFHDITSGSNGFSAVTGYDLVTGWGSPNGASLINALASTTTSPNFTFPPHPVRFRCSGRHRQFDNHHRYFRRLYAAIGLTASGLPPVSP